MLYSPDWPSRLRTSTNKSMVVGSQISSRFGQAEKIHNEQRPDNRKKKTWSTWTWFWNDFEAPVLVHPLHVILA